MRKCRLLKAPGLIEILSSNKYRKSIAQFFCRKNLNPGENLSPFCLQSAWRDSQHFIGVKKIVLNLSRNEKHKTLMIFFSTNQQFLH